MTDPYEMQITRHGGTEEFARVAVDLPSPSPGKVLLRQTAVGVNFIDVYHRKGVFPVPALPGSVGVEAAGTVLAIGEGVTGFAVGDRVAYAGPPVGSAVSHRVMPAAALVRLPDHISDEVAATLMLKGLTAHMLMTRVRPLHPGDTVLLHAAAGGLGSLLSQWAKASGARVIGTVGSEAKADLARAQGCDAVILYKQQDFVEETLRLTDRRGADVVYEGLGGDILTRSLTCLAPFGHAINLGQVGQPLDAVKLADLGPQKSLSVSVPGVFAYIRTLADLQGAADAVFAMVASGALRPVIGHRYPLDDIGAAHRALEAGETSGALVLIP